MNALHFQKDSNTAKLLAIKYRLFAWMHVRRFKVSRTGFLYTREYRSQRQRAVSELL